MKKSLFIISTILVMTLSSLNIALAHDEEINYKFLIGTGPIEEFGHVISMAQNGDTVEMKGEGMFSTHPMPKKVTGNGTLIHRDKYGHIIGTARWTAVRLIGFDSYGEGTEPGLPEGSEGGRALLQIRIWPDAMLPPVDATLRITCAIGDKMPKKAMEGIRLAVRNFPPGFPDTDPINFNREVGHGATLFIRDHHDMDDHED